MILSIEMGGTKWEGLNQQASHQTTLLSVNAKSETFQQKKSMLFACSVRFLFFSETLWGELMQVETWCPKVVWLFLRKTLTSFDRFECLPTIQRQYGRTRIVCWHLATLRMKEAKHTRNHTTLHSPRLRSKMHSQGFICFVYLCMTYLCECRLQHDSSWKDHNTACKAGKPWSWTRQYANSFSKRPWSGLEKCKVLNLSMIYRWSIHHLSRSSYFTSVHRFVSLISCQVGDTAILPVPSTGAASMRNLRIALTKEAAARPLSQHSKERQKSNWPWDSTTAASFWCMGKCPAHTSRCLYWL